MSIQERIVVNPSNHRVASLEKKPVPINTRTFLYHPTRDAIIVEGVGETDADKLASLNQVIADKLKAGYTLYRHHGQHPHSNDFARLDYQQRKAEAGDKYAIEALAAKSMAPAAQSRATDEELALENQLLKERMAEMEAALAATAKGKK